jgi:hypothetical protein
MPLPRVRSTTSGRLPTSATVRDARRHPGQPFADDPPMRFGGPPALEAADSDLHRSYRLRLCCAFRLSQPLDALFRPQPFRPCFMPVTLMGFSLRRFSPAGSRTRLTRGRRSDRISRRALSFVPFPRSLQRRRPEGRRCPCAARGSKDLSTRRIRSRRPVLPGDPRADPPLALPLRGLDPQGLGPAPKRGPSSHGLRHDARRLPAHRHACSAECQRARGAHLSLSRPGLPP